MPEIIKSGTNKPIRQNTKLMADNEENKSFARFSPRFPSQTLIAKRQFHVPIPRWNFPGKTETKTKTENAKAQA